MKKLLAVGAAVAALLVAAPAAASAQEPAGCPDKVAKAQKEFDDAVEAARLRLVELSVEQKYIDQLLELVKDNELSQADQARARQIYEESGFVYNIGLDAPADLAKLNRILHAAAALDAARNEGCDVPDTRDPEPSDPSATPKPSPRDDIDCKDVSYDEAQRILQADPSDPNLLDRDNDGIACEADDDNLSQVGKAPVGGVETGLA